MAHARTVKEDGFAILRDSKSILLATQELSTSVVGGRMHARIPHEYWVRNLTYSVKKFVNYTPNEKLLHTNIAWFRVQYYVNYYLYIFTKYFYNNSIHD